MPENNSIIYDPVAAALSGQTMPSPVLEAPVQQTVEIPQQDSEDEPFSYDGYQVVRGEFFAHIYEPSITFNNCKVNVNTACLNRLPAVSYVQFLVNPEDKKMVVRPCSEDEKDSFRWCSESTRIYMDDDGEQLIDIKLLDGRELTYTSDKMENVDLSYCISIHKSQGAEFPVVIIPILKEHYIMLRRNLLYTAISRAKTKVILIGHRQAVFTAIHKSDVDKRNTVLADRITVYYERETQKRAV